MNKIIIGKYGRSTIRRISNAMQTDHVVVNVTEGVNNTIGVDDIAIKWGTSSIARTLGICYNSAESVALAANKKRARFHMQRFGVTTPNTFNPRNDMPFPFILRPSKHRHGDNFYIVNNTEEYLRVPFDESWYCSSIINKTNEYRVHVGHGKVLFINEKPLSSTDIRANQHITGEGWGTVIGWNDYNVALCRLACDAVKALGLDMGAVDIMKDATGTFCVAEVNTAPTLSNEDKYSIGRYAKYFDWLFMHGNRREWWDYSEWQRGKSFAWKNNQLNDMGDE